MFIKSFAAKIFAKRIVYKIEKWSKKPVETQQKVFKNLISEAKETAFGKDHDFKNIKFFSYLY